MSASVELSRTGRALHYPTVPLNDLEVAADYEPRLRRAGLDSMKALFAPNLGESMSKPGLSEWSERIRLSFEVGGEARSLFLKRFRHPPRSDRDAVRASGSGIGIARTDRLPGLAIRRFRLTPPPLSCGKAAISVPTRNG
jgi:hypothetical protein